MNIKNSFSLFIILLLFLVNYSFAITQFVKYNELSLNVQYGNSITGCQIQNFAVVLDDQYEITSFSSNIVVPWGGVKKAYYEGTKKLFSLSINVPYGITNEIIFDVTNTNQETSQIIVPLTQPLECKKALIQELNITNVGELYLYQGLVYGFNIGIDLSNDYNIAYTLSCKIPFAKYCGLFKNANSYFIYGSTLILDQMNKPTFTVTLSDVFGGSKQITIDNNIFSYSTIPSIVKSIDVTPKNNTNIISTTLDSLKVSFQITYNELNSFPTIKDEKAGSVIQNMGSLILGTPEEQTYLFTTFATGSAKAPIQNYTVYDVAANIEKLMYISYNVTVPTIEQVTVTQQQLSLDLNNETGNLLFKVYLQCSKLVPDIEISPAFLQFNFSSASKLSYPYGYSKSSQNSYYEFNSEGSFPNSIYGGGYQMKIGSFSASGTVGNVSQNGPNFPIPPNTPGLITSDNEGPILRHVSYQLLENNRMLITLNITDVGSGVYFLFSIQPYFSLLAKQALISGDINNGIYQFLVNVDDIQINQLQLSAYDYMGNRGLNDLDYSFTDLDFSSVNPVLQINLAPSDITFFEFDRLEIDTSFDDLQVTLRINFKGAIENGGATPKLIPIYGDSRSDAKEYKGVFNVTTQMYDIKFSVQARERGYFQYLLVIPSLAILQPDIEALFPGQRIKLTSNYVDHFAPIITNFKSLSNVNLAIANEDEQIEIGWDVEIYDYPTGLKNAYFEVVSDKDLEPYKFNFTPDTIVGSDILSTYTIKFLVKPVVNQTYYISKVQLVDKNGYTSVYPDNTGSLNSFASFYNNTFISERNIKVSVSSNLFSNDKTAPTLKSLSFPSSFDSFGINRTVVVEFTVQDDLSGVSTRHNPYVYIQFMYLSFVSVQSQLIHYNTITLTNTYRAVFDLEYGVLAYGAIVSIHGITDNSMNLVSYSSTQLVSKGFPSTIVNPTQTRPPVILEYTNLNENGGKLYIYGKEFTDSPVVYMDKGNGFEIITPSFTSNAALKLNIPSVKGIASIKFKVVSKHTDSNIITIIPIVNPVVSTVSNCSSLNDCSGKGECVNSKCVCSTGSSGPDCSSTTNEINVAPAEVTPSFSSFGSMIEINQLDEIDFNGNVVKSYPLTIWEGTAIQSQYQSTGVKAYQYINTLGTTGTTVTVVVDIFNSPATINFASNKLSMEKGTIKYTISFSPYPFVSRLNSLQLKVNASIIEPVSNSTCKLNSYNLLQGTNSLEWIKLRSNDKSIYGKFIQSGLIDYRSIAIQNTLLVAPTIENQQAIVGINIPYFFQTAVLDPDFSVLLDTDNLGKNTKSSCFKDENGDGIDSGSTIDDYGVNSSGLPKSKVIIISVICSVAGAAIIIATVMLVKKNIIQSKFKKSMSRNTNAK